MIKNSNGTYAGILEKRCLHILIINIKLLAMFPNISLNSFPLIMKFVKVKVYLFLYHSTMQGFYFHKWDGVEIELL